jgi:hypothetical protein
MSAAAVRSGFAGIRAAPSQGCPSAPAWIRTTGLLLRRESLYPAELPGPAIADCSGSSNASAWIVTGGRPSSCGASVATALVDRGEHDDDDAVTTSRS